MIFSVFQGAALALSATIMPGPFQAFLLSKSIQNGWKRTLPAAFAPVITDGPIIGLILLILTRFPHGLVDVLHIAGGLFMLYIANGIFHSLKASDITIEASDTVIRKSLFQAVVMNALNPNPYLFWSVVGGPIILAGWRNSAGLAIGFVIGFFGTFVLGLAGLIILFATVGMLNPTFNRMLRIVAAISLVGFGIYQICVGAMSLQTNHLSFQT
jgi:threonine/homoserine/homoserine lactone efflux protein